MLDSSDSGGSELAVARCISSYLETKGIHAEVDEFVPGRANLSARIRGSDACGSLVFSGHLDTLPIGEQPWTIPPFGAEIRDGRMYGRGTADMKSGVAALTVAFARIAATGRPLRGDLILALSAGESSSCLGAKRFVERGSLVGASALLVAEPTSLAVVTAEMGALWLRITAAGVSRHVSAISPDAACGNAIVRMARIIEQLETYRPPVSHHPLLPGGSLLIGRIAGGSAINVTPDRCHVDVDLRLTPGTSPDALLASLRTAVSDAVSIEIIDYKPPVETAGQEPFVRATTEAARDLNIAGCSGTQGVAYYSDAAVYVPEYRVPFVIIGPGELGMSGRTDEFVLLESVTRATDLYTRIATQWLE